MIINNINPHLSKTPLTTGKTTFKAYMPESFYRHAEKSSMKAGFALRKGLNNLIYFGGKVYDKYKNITGTPLPKGEYLFTEEKIKTIKEDPKKHMATIFGISKIMSREKEVEINIENNELQEIVNDNNSCIFIMNHDNQREDQKLFSFFNALLTREYISNNMEETCPKPAIILNKDIIDAGNEHKKNIGEIIGAVGVDAGIHCSNKFYNGKILSKVIKDLSENKTNLFIFPEGRMTLFKKINPQWKFQSGIADIIRAVAQRKDEVKVIPLGFAYKNEVGGINIGKPLFFKKDGNNILFKPGDIDAEIQDKDYTDFLKNAHSRDGWYTISDINGNVPLKETGEYIAGILCESLTLSKKQAAKSIENVDTNNDTETVYSLEESVENDTAKEVASKPFWKLMDKFITRSVLAKKEAKFSEEPFCRWAETDLQKKGVNVRFNNNFKLAGFIHDGISLLENRGLPFPKNIIFAPNYFKKLGILGLTYMLNEKEESPIILPKNIAENPEEIVKDYENGLFSSSNPHHIFFHEIGHWLHHQKGFDVEKNCETWKNADLTKICEQVSESATKCEDGSDLCAEIFAGQMDKKTFPSTILKLAEKLNAPLI